MLSQHLLGLALGGSEWVLWTLVALSVLSVSFIIERLFVMRSSRDASRLADARRWIERGQAGEAVAALQARSASTYSRLGIAAIEDGESGLMQATVKERARLESRVWLLATIGSNAPFIGLFGTVLGIIHAFHSLGANVQGGAEVVMAGISEALVATAVGLFVAIPAVVAYNSFVRAIKTTLVRADAEARSLIALAEKYRPMDKAA